MPSYYRGIDDEDHIWRIDLEGHIRPSKRQRTEVAERFEKYGIDFNDVGSIRNRKAASFSCSSEEKDMDASSSLESSSAMMTIEDICDDQERIKNILQSFTGINHEMEFLKPGLDKLMELIGPKNNNEVSRQRHRLEMLNSGGHWVISNLLTTLTRKHRLGYRDDDERLVVAVTMSCQILRELLLLNLNNTTGEAIGNKSIGNNDTTVRYQVFCAGGLEAVVSALKAFPMRFHVQLAGCQCLSQLVSCGDTNLTHGRCSNPSATLIKNLYQATDRLNIILRLLSVSMQNSLQSSTNNMLPLSNTQLWQLYFVVSDIVRSVVRQSNTNTSSISRPEVIGAVENYFISESDGSCQSNGDAMAIEESKGSYSDNMNGDVYHSIESEGFINRPFIATSGINGIGRHMYEHLMTILADEDDYFDADAASTSMTE